MATPDILKQTQQRREALKEGMDAMERVVASPAAHDPGRWRAGLKETAAALGSALSEHVRVTEGTDGLFEQVMADAPRLAYAVERLREEHVRLKSEVEHLLADIERNGRADDLVRAAVELLTQLSLHRHTGADLVYEAYSVDLGGTD